LSIFLSTINFSPSANSQVKTIEQEAHSILDQSILKICTFGICDTKVKVIDEIKVQLCDLTARVQKVGFWIRVQVFFDVIDVCMCDLIFFFDVIDVCMCDLIFLYMSR